MTCSKDLEQVLSCRENGSVARMRGKFSPQFKAEIVQFDIETGRPIAEMVRELEIKEGPLAVGSTS